MTLLHMDGFDLGDTPARYPSAWNAGTSTTTAFTYGRSCLGASGGITVSKDITPSGEVIVGTRVRLGGSWRVQFRADAGAVAHITVIADAGTGTITIRRGLDNGTLVATSPIVVANNAWNYIEVRVVVNDATGRVRVRLNGSTTDLLDFNGDTRNGGSSTNIDNIQLYLSNSSSNMDDWYICNTLGTTNNNWLGDVRVYTLAPNGNGNSSQLLGSDANSTDNYLLVDEQPYSGTDYVGSATIGLKDTYALTDLPATVNTVFGVQEVAVVSKSDSGAASLKQVLRSGATDYATAAIPLGTTWASLMNLRETNPATATAWTRTAVNGVEAGVEVA